MSSQPYPSAIGNVDHVLNGVYIGGARAIFHVDALRVAGVRRVLKLYFDEPIWASDFTVCNNALHDGVFVEYPQLKRGVDFIEESVAAEQPVLVLCGAGISRSSTFVLGYLLRRGYTLEAAWRLLKDRHAAANPVLEMWESLIAHYGLNLRVEDVIHWY
jgi:protein-tyrosine phosphatase